MSDEISFRYHETITDEKAQNMAEGLGNSRNHVLNWVRGTSLQGHETPADVTITRNGTTDTHIWAETEYYYAEFRVREDGWGDFHPILSLLRDRVYRCDIRPVPIDIETPPVDEIAHEAIVNKAKRCFDELTTPRNGQPSAADSALAADPSCPRSR